MELKTILMWVGIWLLSQHSLRSQDLPPQVLDVQPVEKAKDAQAQLERAVATQRSAVGRKGPRKMQILHQALADYRAVRRYWPEARQQCGLAAFRRGEIRRALEEEGAARGAFEEVLEEVPRGSDLHQRALLELGHLDRRQGRWRDALWRYGQVSDQREGNLRYRNDGREWTARVHLRTASWDQAEQAALDWAQHCESPEEEVRARDLRIQALIGKRNLRRAAKALEKLQEDMKLLASAPTGEGRRIARALEQLRSPAALKLARQNGR